LAPGNSHVVTGFQTLVAFFDAEPVLEIFNAVLPEWSASERKILFRALAGHHGSPRPKENGPRWGSTTSAPPALRRQRCIFKAMFALMPITTPQ
jgi:hypothetical protein